MKLPAFWQRLIDLVVPPAPVATVQQLSTSTAPAPVASEVPALTETSTAGYFEPTGKHAIVIAYDALEGKVKAKIFKQMKSEEDKTKFEVTDVKLKSADSLGNVGMVSNVVSATIKTALQELEHSKGINIVVVTGGVEATARQSLEDALKVVIDPAVIKKSRDAIKAGNGALDITAAGLAGEKIDARGLNAKSLAEARIVQAETLLATTSIIKHFDVLPKVDASLAAALSTGVGRKLGQPV